MKTMIPPDRGQVNDDYEMSRGKDGQNAAAAFTQPRMMQGCVADTW